jgi:adenylosuccinate synthase
MPATVVVGLQWGDEGKGKAVDVLARPGAVVVRFQGGDNAGHTVKLGQEVFKLHLVPSGVLHPDVTPVIGHGVVVNPRVLLDEIAMLEARGIRTDRLRLSARAHVVMPYHVALDHAMEDRLAKEEIGTTRRGIGPAYADRALRIGIRVEDLLDPSELRAKLERVVPQKDALLAVAGDLTPRASGLDIETLHADAVEWGKALAGMVTDTTRLVQDALAEGGQVLCEGAQGTLLDLDHGTYPYVTSSSPTAAGACVGTGLAPTQVDEVVGVMKAYATRVGSGPFPTEIIDANAGAHLSERGQEYGTTTGRRRRCGWFDAVSLRHAVRLNGVSSVMLNKLDVLTGLDEICVAVAYEVDGNEVMEWPLPLDLLSRARPIYRRFAGWDDELGDARTMADLPPAAARYVDALEELAGVPITIVSVGPERAQTLDRVAGGREQVPAVSGARG